MERGFQFDFLVAPVPHLAGPHLLVEFAVQFVLVGLIHARAQRRQALLRAGDLFFALCLRPAFIRAQLVHDRRDNVIGNIDVLEYSAEPVGKPRFRHVRQIAFAAPIGAAIVDVFPLVQFRGDGTAVVGAGEQTGEGEIMLPALALIPTGENVLHALKQGRIDQRLVIAFVLDFLPAEVTKVEAVLE